MTHSKACGPDVTGGKVMSRSTRKGFTLVEMLVVLSIVVVVSVIIIPFIARSNDKDIVPRGARFLQGALMQARSRAQLERTPNGVRLLPTTVVTVGAPLYETLAWSEQFEYIHDPGDFIDGFAQGPLDDTVVLLPMYHLTVVAGPSPMAANFFNNNQATPWTGEPVRPGDYIEFLGNGQLFQIMGFPGGVTYPPYTQPPYNLPATLPAINGYQYGATMLLSRPLTPTLSQPLSQTNYRIIRKPRPVPGERPMEMPRGVVVDLTGRFNDSNPPGTGMGQLSLGDRDLGNVLWMRGISSRFNLANTVDIMFGPSGQVVGDAAANDIIYLWLHPSAEPNNWMLQNPGAALGDAANQSLVVVYSRNGTTASFPVDQRLPQQPFTPSDPNPDPYSYAKSARAQSVGGL
jgi:prepilin-type N-terminal cleavage/methylation domain-containing protein